MRQSSWLFAWTTGSNTVFAGKLRRHKVALYRHPVIKSYVATFNQFFLPNGSTTKPPLGWFQAWQISIYFFDGFLSCPRQEQHISMPYRSFSRIGGICLKGGGVTLAVKIHVTVHFFGKTNSEQCIVHHTGNVWAEKNELNLKSTSEFEMAKWTCYSDHSSETLASLIWFSG